MNEQMGQDGTSVALVTGASRGIGALIAEALARNGWRVALLGRTQDRLESVASTLQDGGASVIPVQCDVTDAGAVEAAVQQVISRWGRIDLLVNNAGSIEPEVPLWEADVDQWWDVLEANVRGPFLMCRGVIPGMIEAGGGRIININSGAGTRERGSLTAYTASKSALARITGGLHESGAEFGVKVFDLAPGVVRTDMTRSMAMHRDRTEWTDPEDVTALMLALASGELDEFSGRMVRAGSDSIDQLREVAARGLEDDARKIRLRPWGSDDPLQS